MADFIRMKAKTTFHNDRIRGGANGVVSDGDVFETDPNHARDLARLGHAEPISGSLDEIGPAPLQPHYSVSNTALQAQQVTLSLGIDPAAARQSVADLERTVAEARARAADDIAGIERAAAERLDAIARDLATAERQRDERLRALAAEVSEAEAVAQTAIAVAEARAAATAERSEPETGSAEGEGEGASSATKKRRGNA